MPELPEVETVRRGLVPFVEGALIGKVELRRPDLRFPFPKGFARKLAGRRLMSLDRRAKYLVAGLDDGALLAMHLGMTGSFRISSATGSMDVSGSPGGQKPAHDHVVFHMKSGKGEPFRLVYNDPRRFGYMDLIAGDKAEGHRWFASLGVEPLSQEMTPDALAPLFEGRGTSLKTMLLDQKTIAGLGNIYVCEALWRTGLSPAASASTLVSPNGRPTAKLAELVVHVRDVLQESIVAGGSTLKDYRKADGGKGSFQERFSVYGREGLPCVRKGCEGLVSRTVQSGRSTFSCDGCQPG